MNNWKNYETWNIALWISNDKVLYDLASKCKDYASLLHYLGSHETKDGVSYSDPKLCINELDEFIRGLYD